MYLSDYRVFHEFCLNKIQPGGWLKDCLYAQKEGLTGHLNEIGYPYNQECWGLKKLTDGGFQEWWPYEQTAYWIDSIVRLAILLKDKEIYKKAAGQLEKALALAEDGFVGPKELKIRGKRNQWPHAILFRALIVLAEAGEEITDLKKEYIIERLCAHYLSETSDYSSFREVVNTESMWKLYEMTGRKELAELAQSAYEKFIKANPKDDSGLIKMLSEDSPYQHGVTYNEQAKLPAIFYMHTGDAQYLNASVNAYEKIDKFHMLPDGVHSSCEYTMGKDALKAHETCDIADYSWSMGYLLMATGDAKYADNIEKACFNAAFGAIGPYFRTIQYFSGVNQVIAARNSTHIENFGNTPRFAYQPHHYPECCVGNVGRIFPNYAARMFMEMKDGLACCLYGDAVLKTEKYTIEEKSNYPFEEIIHFKIICDTPQTIKMGFRIPAWCHTYQLTCNGRILKGKLEKGFLFIHETFSDQETINLHLQMDLVQKNSVEGGRFFEYGPFLMALSIKERWVVDAEEPRQTKDFPAFNVYADSPWNYAVPSHIKEERIQIIKRRKEKYSWYSSDFLNIKLSARTVSGYTTIKKKININSEAIEKLDDAMISLGASQVFQELELTPEIPDKAYVQEHIGGETEITLVPYGTTQLRITVFPIYEEA